MCGRFSMTYSRTVLRDYFLLDDTFDPEPRYNIAPGQDIAAVRQEEGRRRLVSLHWGLIPFWADDRKIGYRTLNARSETAHGKPAFRAAFRSRRCLIPATGFYEWNKRAGTRQPYYIYRTDRKPMAFAGLWEHWEDREGKETIESCTILTTEAAHPVAVLHDRMPVILESENFHLWLDPHEQRVEKLLDLIGSTTLGTLAMYPVAKYVNKAGNEGKGCIEPVS
ncbi:SOS response-associated peptidase [Desulfuromonas sp. CSMB_57]|uniref:SOS response-associated peptidase n=1 Tax=Desulfuromonas sp. CSMB_57 TaxID=2807629 RepID=UPI0024BE1D51|nr:SOS response-associated peptidase [Desulfuromonas sp. CSMB_57]